MRTLSGLVVVGLTLSAGVALAEPDPTGGVGGAKGPTTPSPDAAGTSTAPGVVVVGAPKGGGDGDAKLSVHGYLRAPLRIGTTTREAPLDNQTNRSIHTPRLPDDQYLNWNYTRAWEKDWAELFVTYGTARASGTIVFQAFNFTDAGYNNADAQFGIGQGFLTFLQNLGVAGLRVGVKVGSFWNRYGMAGKYDAGRYDTYLFGRTHAMGEVIALEYDVSDVTLRLSHGIGARAEQGNCSGGAGCNFLASPNGYTLLNHAHGGVSYKQLFTFNAHYLGSWSQDEGAGVKKDRPDGTMSVFGAEALLDAGIGGRLYAGFSRIHAVRANAVGPVIEVIHAYGGGYYGLGVADQFLGPKSDNGTGDVDTVMVQYDYSIGLLARKLKNPDAQFYGDGSDIVLGLFAMHTRVKSVDSEYDGMKKTKFGADVLWTPVPWFGLGARVDRVNPGKLANEKLASGDPVGEEDNTFTVISPRVLLRSKFLSREEVTIQYSRYVYGANVKPVAPLDKLGTDKNVFGIKATMWW